MMETKYQIFISSTFEDLKSERQQAIKAIMEMGHIPVGMEMFSAGDETQWQLIKRQILDCDYYVVIIAHRYGSMDDGISYTEKEFNFAVENKIPIIGFIINDNARWAKTKIDMEPVLVAKINDFKTKIKSRIIDYWNNSQDLKGKVSVALVKQMNINPRTGWMKASNLSDPDVLNEISRLSKENAELRSEIDQEKNQEAASHLETLKKASKLLSVNKIKISFFYTDSESWENTTEFAYSAIFKLLAPELQGPKSTEQIANFIGIMKNPKKEKSVRASFPVPSNTIKTVFTDFSILKLVQVIKESNNNGNEMWVITDFGKEVYANERLKMLEKNYPKEIA
jgi:hypothetical protein